MDRFVWRGDVFEPLDLSAWYESQYEERLLSLTSSLYPGWVSAPFKQTVYANGEVGVRPDLILVDTRLRGWYVVEVELSHHSIPHHILPQIETMTLATYPSHLAAIVAGLTATKLDPGQVAALVRGVTPRFMVIIDAADRELVWNLAALGCETSIVRIYRNAAGAHAFARAGDVPRVAEPVLTAATYVIGAIRGLRLERPDAIACGHLERIALFTEYGESQWVATVSGATKCLLAVGRVPLDEGILQYEIVRLDDGRLWLRPSQITRKRRST